MESTIPRTQLRAEKAQVVDLDDSPDTLVMVRSALASETYSGWYRPKEGDRALVVVTRDDGVVVVPTTLGYTLVLTPLDPYGFVNALQP